MRPPTPMPNEAGTSSLLPPFWMVLAFWTLVAIIAAGHAGVHHEHILGGVAYELANHWAWAALTPLIFLLGQRFPLDRRPLAGALVLHLLAGAVVGILWGVFSEYAHLLLAHPENPVPPFPRVLRNYAALGFSSGFLVYFAILAAGHAVSFYWRLQERRKESMSLRTELAEARLKGLRMQLQPHFLFNTLNTISGLVESDPVTTRRVVARLSDLLRHSLEGEDALEIPLREEIGLLEDYLEIVRVRFQDGVRVELDLQESALDRRVPPLSLQPLVENAVEHGAPGSGEPTHITVSARTVGDYLELRVRDNGEGLEDAGAVGGGGVGLGNLRERLAQLYEGAGSLTLNDVPGGGLAATIRIPLAESRVYPGWRGA